MKFTHVRLLILCIKNECEFIFLLNKEDFFFLRKCVFFSLPFKLLATEPTQNDEWLNRYVWCCCEKQDNLWCEDVIFMCIQIYFVTFLHKHFPRYWNRKLTEKEKKMTHKTGSGYRYPAEKLDECWCRIIIK